MTNHEIAEASGLSKGTVAKLSTCTTWASIPVGVMDRFMAACGVTRENIPAHRKFLRRQGAYKYRQDADGKQKQMFERLNVLYEKWRDEHVLAVVRKMEQMSPTKYAGLEDKVIAFWNAERKWIAEFESKSPNGYYVTTEVYETFLEKNEPRCDEDDWQLAESAL